MPTWHRGATPSLMFIKPTFEATLAPHMPTFITVRGSEDMLSSPLDQQILSYELPRGFVILYFSMYDGFSDPYDLMLHFNKAMILNAGDDCLLCKVFPTSLKGPSLAWFHKLLQRSINSFSELLVAFVPSTCAQFNRRETSVLCKPSSSGRMIPFAISLEDLEGPSNRLILIAWMRSSRIFEGALG